MNNGRTIGGGQNNPAPQTQNNSNGISFAEIKDQDWFRILVSAISATVVYFTILWIIPDSSEPWVRHLIVLVMSILVFAFIGFAQKERGKLGDAIVTFLILIFGLQMAIAYL